MCMKKYIKTGDWNGEPIYRQESAEETLLRELKESEVFVNKVDLSNLSALETETNVKKN